MQPSFVHALYFFIAAGAAVAPDARAQVTTAAEAPDVNAATDAANSDPNENPPPLADPETKASAPTVENKPTSTTAKKTLKRNKPWMIGGVRLSTMVPSPIPIPTAFEGKAAAYVGVRLLDVDLNDNFAVFLRAKLSGAYANGAAVYQPSFIPFDDKGGLSLLSERYQVGPDLACGLRMGPVEALLDVGLRGGFDVNIARYFGPRVALEARYLFTESVGIGLLYEFQHTVSLGDVSPGWTSSSSGFGVSVSASY